MSIASLVGRREGDGFALGLTHAASDLNKSLSGLVNDTQLQNAKIGESALGFESTTDDMKKIVTTSSAMIRNYITDKVAPHLNMSMEASQIDAAVIAGLMSTDAKGFNARQLVTPAGVTERMAASDVNLKRTTAFESYTEADFRQNMKSSIAYNIMTSKQDAFSEAFFGTIIMNPTLNGVVIEINRSFVYNDYIRATSGELAEVGRRDIIRAFVSPEVLHNRLAAIVPIYREDQVGENDKMFVDTTIFPVEDVYLGGGITVETAPLKFGEEFDLMGLAQRDDVLAAGVMDSTDVIAPSVRINDLFFNLDGQGFKVNVFDVPTSVFEDSQQDDTRRVNLVFSTRDVVVTRGIKTVKGEEPTGDAAILAKYDVLLNIEASGYVFLDTGVTSANVARVRVLSVTDENGEHATKDEFDKVKALFKNSSVLDGYKLNADFENLNLRENGQLLENKTYKLLIPVSYDSPVTVVSPVSQKGEHYDRNLANLTSITNITASAKALTRLESGFETLRNYRAIPDKDGNLPKLNFVGSFYVIPAWTYEKISFADLVDSTRSANRFLDARAALLERIHTHIMDLIVRSELVPVGMRLTGQQAYKPHVVIGTDQKLAAYLRGEGEGVYAREDYTYEIVSSVNKNVHGKIWIGFRSSKSGISTTEIDPLSTGNFILSPEIVSSQEKSFNNQHSHYLTVTPRREHVLNLPVLGLLEITDIEAISKKIPMHILQQEVKADDQDGG